MINRVIATVEKFNMLAKGDGVVIGLSGGADSVTLLAVLVQLAPAYDLRLYPVHINHGIRGQEALRDEAFAKSLCKNLGLECRVIKRDVPALAREWGLSTEEAGRQARYQAFSLVAEETGSSKIAVAHNLNDNGETVLMRLCRGTGIRGLTGIAPVRDNIIRPLIEVSRREIEDYCSSHGLSYCTDSTNLERDYTRNKVRLELIPWLEENLNPSVIKAINKSACLMADEEAFLEGLAAAAYKECSLEGGLRCSSLEKLDVVLQRRVIRRLMAQQVKTLRDIAAEHIDGLIALAVGKSGKSLSLPYGLRGVKEYDCLKIEAAEAPKGGFCYELRADEPVFVAEIGAMAGIYRKKQEINGKILYTNCFKCDIINGGLYFRSRQKGDKIYLSHLGGSKRVKKLLNEKKVPLSQRDSLPMLADTREVIWIYGLALNKNCLAQGEGGLYFYLWRNC